MVVVFLPCLVAFKTFHSHHVAYAAACTCFHLKTFHTCIKEHCLMQLHDIIDFSLPGVCVEVGREVVCCMLDVNWSESCIIVSLNTKLTEGHDAIEQEGRRKSSKRRKRRKQTLVWDDAMVTVDNHNPLFLYLPLLPFIHLFHLFSLFSIQLPLPSSSLAATVEHTTPHYLLCSCTTLSGTHLAYGLMDTVSAA